MKSKLSKIVILALMVIMSVGFIGKPNPNPVSKNASSWLSGNTIVLGQSYTVTVSAPNAAGYVSASASNGSVSPAGQIWVDGGSVSFTVTPVAVGTSTVSVSGVLASYDTGVDANYGWSGSVNVVNAVNQNPETPGNSGNSGNTGTETPTKPEETKPKTTLTLSTLSVSPGTLSPAFDPSTTGYNVELTSDKKQITVDARATDGKATVSGTGKHAIKEGDNTIEVVTSDEEGNKQVYTIKVTVEKAPTVFLENSDIGKGKFGILQLMSAPLTPGFDDATIKIDGKDVEVRKSEKMGITLVYMVNEQGKRNFYIYDEKTKEIISIYIPVSLKGRSYAIVTPQVDYTKEIDVTKATVQIDKQNFDGWKFKDQKLKDYALVYLMNDKGVSGLYQFEASEDTLQLYNNTAAITMEEYKELANKSSMLPVMFGVSGILGLMTIGSIIAFLLMKKRINTK
ncbi:cadherin-like protein [Breznakia blatticola]|uniref:Cadherin-like protein n=1 Tax=Breznakia blatticola TaxID=1754012 RepID=A0A4R7Z8J9_9FIRM|nr:cadherin-like beta sandwich domain-containing protein [Breznakia blatticola]TDW09702.1 cadherin-like protein [Breznakia blatticola]